MDIIWSGLFYIFGCGFSILLSAYRMKSKIDNSKFEHFDRAGTIALASTIMIITYALSSWIGVIDIIIDSTIEYCKSENRKISDEEISEWFKK